VRGNLPMAKSDFVTIKANLQPSVNVVDRRVHDGVESLEANSTVDTGGPIFAAYEKYHSLTTLQQTKTLISPLLQRF
jgi:hypothetical protein